jgi:hypothetical protein
MQITKKGGSMKEAVVYKSTSGYWVAECIKTGLKIGGYHDSELDAYKAANRSGYLVR